MKLIRKSEETRRRSNGTFDTEDENLVIILYMKSKLVYSSIKKTLAFGLSRPNPSCDQEGKESYKEASPSLTSSLITPFVLLSVSYPAETGS